MGGSGGGSSSLVGIAVESQDYREQLRAAILAVDGSAGMDSGVQCNDRMIRSASKKFRERDASNKS